MPLELLNATVVPGLTGSGPDGPAVTTDLVLEMINRNDNQLATNVVVTGTLRDANGDATAYSETGRAAIDATAEYLDSDVRVLRVDQVTEPTE